MAQVYVGLGGNIGDTAAVFERVLSDLSSDPKIEELKTSSFYRTSPVGPIPQYPFLNAVCGFKTSYTPRELLNLLERIETCCGKREKPKNAPRIIDLDLLLFGDEAIEDEGLEIPHPRLLERLFVLIPLAEIAQNVVIPGQREVKVSELLSEFKNEGNQTVKVFKGSYGNNFDI